jgi:uncharacterized membrane protein YuzA (DUF378 family)
MVSMFGHKFYLVTLAIIIVGALNWGLVGAFDFNAVELLGNPSLISAVYIAVGLSALVHLFRRDYYLPFLGSSAFPCGPLQPKTPQGANTAIEITTVPNSNVVFWAAEPSTDRKAKDNPWFVAYDAYLNSGVTRSDGDGRAILRVRMPSSYTVPYKGELDPHIHYRTCLKGGMLSPVETVFVK